MAAEILIALKTGVEFFFFDILSYLDLDLDFFFFESKYHKASKICFALSVCSRRLQLMTSSYYSMSFILKKWPKS